MAYYLVRAAPKADRLPELAEKLRQNAFVNLRPFGQAVSHGLNNARWESDTVAIWEEEDYCSPPLAMERAAVLDHYFDNIRVERVQKRGRMEADRAITETLFNRRGHVVYWRL